MGTVLDPYKGSPSGIFKWWGDFSASTMAVVQLRRSVDGWTVPRFKLEAAQIYTDVGDALAAGDEAALRKLTTPSCLTTMLRSLRSRPKGQRHRWETLDVTASVRQVRIGHHASAPERRFAQVTCEIQAQIIWSIKDRKGGRVSGLGSKEAPHAANDIWVFERCIADPVEPPVWRLKEKLSTEEAANA
jgi:predicted lipid-binding transport protein (Tim44 family)